MPHFGDQFSSGRRSAFLRNYISPMKMNYSNIPSAKRATNLFQNVLLLFALATVDPTVGIHAATPTTPHAFHIKNQWIIGGKGGWGLLCLDATTHQLYIPRANRVMVVDTETGKVSGEVQGLTNVREVALDDSGKFGYVTDVTDGTAGFVRVFDRSTLKLVTSIPTGLIPEAILFDPATKDIFALNARSHSVTVIGSASHQVIATIPLSGRPSYAVTDGKGSIFVALPALAEITRIDTAAKKVTTSWQLTPCTGPNGLAIDNAHHQLFTTCEDHKLISINADTGHVTAIGNAPANSGDIRFDAKQNLLFLADTSGTLTLFRRDPSNKYSVLQKVKTQPGARTMTEDPEDAKAYLVTSKFGQNTSGVSEELQFRPTPTPDSFSVIVVGR
jgi:YVTN family beta-propeller protein